MVAIRRVACLQARRRVQRGYDTVLLTFSPCQRSSVPLFYGSHLNTVIMHSPRHPDWHQGIDPLNEGNSMGDTVNLCWGAMIWRLDAGQGLTVNRRQGKNSAKALSKFPGGKGHAGDRRGRAPSRFTCTETEKPSPRQCSSPSRGSRPSGSVLHSTYSSLGGWAEGFCRTGTARAANFGPRHHWHLGTGPEGDPSWKAAAVT